MTEGIQEAYVPASALEIIVDMAEMITGNVCAKLDMAWQEQASRPNTSRVFDYRRPQAWAIPIMVAFVDGIRAFDQRMARHFGDPPQEPLGKSFFEIRRDGELLTTALDRITSEMQVTVIDWELLPRTEFQEFIIRPLTRVVNNLTEVEDDLFPRQPPPQDDEPQIHDLDEETDPEVEPSSPLDQEMKDQDA